MLYNGCKGLNNYSGNSFAFTTRVVAKSNNTYSVFSFNKDASFKLTFGKALGINKSRLEAQIWFYRLFIKGKFVAYLPF